MDAEFLEMLSTTISVRATTAVDAYGKPTVATVVSNVPARVEMEYKVFVDPQGRVMEIAGRAFIDVPATQVVNPNQALIVLPDASECRILAWDLVDDENGPHHVVITFGPRG